MTSTRCGVCQKVIDENAVSRVCEYCDAFHYCSKKCQRSRTAKAHEEECAYDESDDDEDCSTSTSSEQLEFGGSLRFGVGEEVLCSIEGGIAAGKIIETWSHEYNAPYIIELHHNGACIWAPKDRNSCIRRKYATALEQMLHAVRDGDPITLCHDLAEGLNLDITVVSKQLLFEAATYGRFYIARWLLKEYVLNTAVVDARGRTILMVAILYKQIDFVEQLHEEFEINYTARDDKGLNVLHYIIMSEDVKFMHRFLFEDYFNMHDIEFVVNELAGDEMNWGRLGEKQFMRPLDYAKRLKKNEMMKLLEMYDRKKKVYETLKISFFARKESVDEMIAATTRLAAESIDPKEFQGLDVYQIVLCLRAIEACREGRLDNMQFLIETLGFDWNREWKQTNYVSDVIEAVIAGPEEQYFDIRAFAKDVEVIHSDCKEEMDFRGGMHEMIIGHQFIFDNKYNDGKGWDGQEEIMEYIRKQSASYGNQTVSYETNDWVRKEVAMKNYIVKWLRRQEGRLIAERVRLLDVLLLQYPSFKSKLQSHLFIQYGQLHLLQWAIAAEHIHPNALLTSDPALLDFARQETFIESFEVTKKKGKKKKKIVPFTADTTVAEYLYALAAAFDEIFIFRWLREEFIVERTKRWKYFKGGNVLHIASARNSCAIIKILLRDSETPKSDLTASGLNACHIALDKGHELLAHYLLNEISFAEDFSINSTVWHLMRSECSILRALAEKHSMLHQLKDLYREMKHKSINRVEYETRLQSIGIQNDDFRHICYVEPDFDSDHEEVMNSVSLKQCFSTTDIPTVEQYLFCLFKQSLLLENIDVIELFSERIAKQDDQTFLYERRMRLLLSANRFACERNASIKTMYTLNRFVSSYTDSVKKKSLLEEVASRFLRLFNQAVSVSILEEEWSEMQRQCPSDMVDDAETAVINSLYAPKHLHIVRWAYEKHKKRFYFSALRSELMNAVRTRNYDLAEYLIFLAKLYADEDIEDKQHDSDDNSKVYEVEKVGEMFLESLSSIFSYVAFGERPFEEIISGTEVVLKFEKFVIQLYRHLVSMGIDVASDFCDEHSERNAIFDAITALQFDSRPSVWRLVKWLCKQPEVHFRFTSKPYRFNDFFHNCHSPPSLSSRVHNKSQIIRSSAEILRFMIDQGADVANITKSLFNCFWYGDWAGDVCTSLQLLQPLIENGSDIQHLKLCTISLDSEEQVKLDHAAAVEQFAEIKKQQRLNWSIADAIASGKTRDELKHHLTTEGVDIRTSMDRSGNSIIEVAVIHDRPDVIEWLLHEHNMSIYCVNKAGDNLLKLCLRSGAKRSLEQIADTVAKQMIQNFCFRNYHRRRIIICARKQRKARISATVKLQAAYRRYAVFIRYRPILQEAVGDRQLFTWKWSKVQNALQLILRSKSDRKPFSWAALKFQYNIALEDEEMPLGDDSELSRLLTDSAYAGSSNNGDEKRSMVSKNTDDFRLKADDASSSVAKLHIEERLDLVSDNPGGDSQDYQFQCHIHSIQLSQPVVRWLDLADGTYRELFRKRIDQLAQGQRSYALSKRLKCCSCPIYEAKLDSGQRILWTRLCRGDDTGILVWFVAKHDAVSRCIRLIERSFDHAVRQQIDHTIAVDIDHSEPALLLSEEAVLLDPRRNVPMKIYSLDKSELPLLGDKEWKTPLQLNKSQQRVRLQLGTVLLLGRSGTGKTLSLIDRMAFDRSHWSSLGIQKSTDSTINQLFVCRSRSLCEFVRRYQEHYYGEKELLHSKFLTFDEFLFDFQRHAGIVMKEESKRINYPRFLQELFPTMRDRATSLDPLLVWTQIRSFIKGSIEAAFEDGALSLNTYLDISLFPASRCGLTQQQRREAFQLYQRYKTIMDRYDYWDDTDRVMEMILPTVKKVQCSAFANKNVLQQLRGVATFGKIYVDEAQDCTQTELTLFLIAAGCNSDALFLAGDPAQSIMEGTEFRFEEIRALVHRLSGKHEALQRPTKLLVNYRSHSGILECAAAILNRLLSCFPGAASNLGVDKGLFIGPRPSYCQLDNISELMSLLKRNERMVIVCPDHHASSLQSALSTTNGSSLIMGIRAAKGLEFSDVILVDFFSTQSATNYKAWKQIFGSHHQSKCDTVQVDYPHLQPQLKLLYTAITRCVNRLLFIETQKTQIGSLFFRWLQTNDLATNMLEDNNEEMIIMTCDEWRMRGINIAITVTDSPSDPDSDNKLGQAIKCFEKARDTCLESVATVHLKVIQLIRTLSSNKDLIVQDLNQQKQSIKWQSHTEMEVEIAHIMLNALQHGLYSEVYHIARLLETLISPPQQRKLFNIHILEHIRKVVVEEEFV